MRNRIIEKLECAKGVRQYYLDEVIKLEAKIEVYEELLAEDETPEEMPTDPVDETPTL